MTAIQPRAVRDTPLPDYVPVWQSGPPPNVGWWPASIGDDVRVLRFWNGEFWSDWVVPYSSIQQVEMRCCHEALSPQSEIRWAQRWWE